ASHVVWFPAVPPGDVAVTLAIVAAGVVSGVLLRVPGGSLLVPMILGGLVESAGIAHIALPPWLLAACYALLGWIVGLGLPRWILAPAGRAVAPGPLSIPVLVAVCGALAAVLVAAAGVDPLSAYLATTPGGMDTVAIIAASSNVDLSFVMALQTVRFVIVL